MGDRVGWGSPSFKASLYTIWTIFFFVQGRSQADRHEVAVKIIDLSCLSRKQETQQRNEMYILQV